MENFKEEIENSGMSFTEGGSYEAKNKENIYLNLAECSEQELRKLPEILKDEDIYPNDEALFKVGKYNKDYPLLHLDSDKEWIGADKECENEGKTPVSFTQFMEIMEATETEKVEVFDIDFSGICMARMEIQNGKFKFTNAMNGGGYPIAIEDIKITPTN